MICVLGRHFGHVIDSDLCSLSNALPKLVFR